MPVTNPNAQPVPEFLAVVLTDLTVVALTSPLSTLADWTVLVDFASTPSALLADAALVSMVPVASAGGALTEVTVLVWVTPGCDVHPRVESAERPDFTVEPTVTWLP